MNKVKVYFTDGEIIERVGYTRVERGFFTIFDKGRADYFPISTIKFIETSTIERESFA